MSNVTTLAPSLDNGAPSDFPALLAAETAAKICSLSLRTWRRLEAEGNVPASVHVGGRIKRYRRNEILAWIDAGCPSGEEWKSRQPIRRAK